ncbi:MAG TPA: TadE/TadG family type IV pilus assembly protein [Stellaceae bacterium]|jgi:Flp pilus assembly protein TadG|nr:TadE/TadG family type IV pilus assembly protein [Stellaceae bacterium]
MTIRQKLRARWRKGTRELWRDRDGVVAVEFALVLPTLIVLFIGTFEASNLVRVKMKFDAAAPAIASLVAEQNPSKTGTLTSDFCTGAAYLLAPYSTSNLNVVVSSVTNHNGTSSVDWTATCNNLSNPQSATTLATGLVPTTGDSVIVVQTTYLYNAPIHMILGASYTFQNDGFSRPRSNSQLQYAP